MREINFGFRFFDCGRGLLLLSMLGIMLMSCGNSSQPGSNASTPSAAEPATPSVSKIDIPRDSVVTLSPASAPSQSYSIYYPAKAGKPASTPILICFDPHADGRLPIDKYRKWADKYKVAIAGSNSSQNGLSGDESQQIAANMIADISSRLGFDERNMALCGFSGGAKVAIAASGAASDIPNLMYAGAVMPLGAAHPVNVLGYAGTQDMNYTDLLQFDQSIQSTVPSAALIEFGGKHEWPDAMIFEHTFYWLCMADWKQKTVAIDSAVLKDFVQSIDKKIANAESQSDWIGAYEKSHTAYVFLNGLTDVTSYKNKMTSISGKEAYKLAVQQKNDALGKEANAKQMLMPAFQNQGLDWWTKVINGYNASKNPADKRLLGFISLGCYSYANQMLQQGDLTGAERILAIYEASDPDNTDQLYFHAVLYANQGKKSEAIKYLQKAVIKGFKNLKKIESEQAFIGLQGDPSYSQVLASLKNSAR